MRPIRCLNVVHSPFAALALPDYVFLLSLKSITYISNDTLLKCSDEERKFP